MAEKTNLLVAPQNNKLEGSTAEKATANTNDLIGNNSVVDPPSFSLGSSYHGESSGRSSPIKISTPKSKQKVIPNYLRPSRGSCHDLCKYGRRLTDEPIHWRSLPKRNGKPPIDIFVSKNPPVSVERKKVIVMKPMHRDINLSPDHVMVSAEPAEITSSKKVEFPPKGSEIGKRMSEIVRKSPRHYGAKDVKFAVRSKSATSVDASQGKLVRSRSYGVIRDAKTSVASKPSLKNVLARSKSLTVFPSSTGDVNADRRRNLKLVPCTKDQSSSQKARRSKPKNEEISKALIDPLPSKFVSDPLSSHGHNHVDDEKKDVEEKNNNDGAPDDKEEKMEREINKDEKGERAEGDSRYIDDKATILLSTNTGRKKQNGKEIAPMTNKTTKKNGKDTAKVNPAMIQRKGIAVILKDKDSSLAKMKFQRGRTVELQSASTGPRKLKFKGAKVLLVNQDGKADVKKFRKAVINKVRVKVNPKSKNVVLRHRSVEDKKDVQGLFNNVIEETASKLAQSRKSKVKALVGAFETIISLQDTKPSSNVVTEGDTLPDS